MGVYADEVVEILAESGYGQVYTGALDALGIGKERNAVIRYGEGGNDVARAVRAAAIGNNDAENTSIHRAGEFSQQRLDRLCLVEAGNDDQSSDAGMTKTFHDLPPTHYTGENAASRAWPEADFVREDNCWTS